MSGLEILITLLLGASAWVFGPLAGLPSWYVAYRYLEPAFSAARSRIGGGEYPDGARFLYPAIFAITVFALVGIGVPAWIAWTWRGNEYAWIVATVAAATLVMPYAFLLSKALWERRVGRRAALHSRRDDEP